MTDHERAISLLAAAYSAVPLTEQQMAAYVVALEDLDAEAVHLAVVDLIRQPGSYRPTPGDVRKAVLDLARGERLDAGLAWAEVWDAIRFEGRHRQPAWSDPLIADAVRAVGGFVFLCDSTNPTADRARFIDAYGRLAAREDRAVLTAPALGPVMAELTARFALPAGDDDSLRGDR
jgi:hypothetical protein